MEITLKRRSILTSALLVLLVATGSQGASAKAVWTPDLTFGQSGVARSGLQSTWPMAALDRRGRILVGINPGGGSRNESRVARYLANGRLDRSFGRDGITQPLFPGGDYSTLLTDLEVTADGGIVAVSTNLYDAAGDARYGIQIVKYFANGSVDRSFGVNGRFLKSPSLAKNPIFTANAAVVRADGRILVAGAVRAHRVGGSAATLLLLNRDGTVNRGFGDNGSLRRKARGDLVNEYTDVLLSGSRAIASGLVGDRMVVDRVTRQGRFDRTFGNRGNASIKMHPLSCETLVNACYLGTKMARSPGGIVYTLVDNGVDGRIRTGTSSKVVALNRHGDRVRNFGRNGVQTYRMPRRGGSGFIGSAIAFTMTGRVVLSGSVSRSGKLRSAISMMNRNGRPVTSLNSKGVQPNPVKVMVRPTDAVLDSRGRLVIVGSPKRVSEDLVLARLTAGV